MIAVSFAVVYFAVLLPKKRADALFAQKVRAYYEAKLSSYEKENAEFADYEVEVAFLGDSLTDGYDLARYSPQYVTVNRDKAREETREKGCRRIYKFIKYIEIDRRILLTKRTVCATIKPFVLLYEHIFNCVSKQRI